MDFITCLPRINCNHDSVWVVVDRLTKLVKFKPTTKDVKTPKLAGLFIKHVYRLYGLLIDIVSNRHRKFDSHFWSKIFQKIRHYS